MRRPGAAGFRASFDIAGVEQYSTASIGIALFNRRPVSVDEVLKRADLAMYQAKAAGRNTAWRSSIRRCRTRESPRRTRSETAHALARGEFLLHYQPLADA
jgi:predicted signal transduction protein with EAL and GGDEF domain